ncbi:translation initiation factor IF-2-like [Ischnura elegans]|uniref:translation initiation factor IF-2-like n=1 Tax=Ischnura elegans TaxID=197161 RepID=UPI001ED89C72|nr:translation initiation factor IF-2-like [Ischnura elegans]
MERLYGVFENHQDAEEQDIKSTPNKREGSKQRSWGLAAGDSASSASANPATPSDAATTAPTPLAAATPSVAATPLVAAKPPADIQPAAAKDHTGPEYGRPHSPSQPVCSCASPL